MKRFDLLRSPLLVLAVGVLLLNDFVLKAAFHNWLTGKLSDVAGLAAFAIFCCALWPKHVCAVGGAITVLFAFWKSPYASGAIEVANAVLPFTIGRTVDYSDMLALPVVWLVCGNAHCLPLVDVGKVGVWLTAGVCLFAFTATSSADPHYTLSVAAEIPAQAAQSDTEAAIAQLLDEVAARHGLGCNRCSLLSEGRVYRGQGLLQVAAGFDAEHNRLLFEVSAYGGSQTDIDKVQPEVDRVKAEIEQALKQRFPAVSVSDPRPAFGKSIVVRVFLPPIDDQFDQAFAITDDVLRRAGFKLDKTVAPGDVHGVSRERARVSALLVLPAVTSWATHCRGDGTFAVAIDTPSSDYAAQQQQIVGELENGLVRAFGRHKASVEGLPLCH
jgi:hypothetical protein